MSFSGATISSPGGLSSLQVAARQFPSRPAGHFGWALTGGSGNVTPPAADRINAYPWFLERPLTIQTIFCHVNTGGAGSSMKLALLRNNPATNLPTGLPVLGSNTPFDTSISSTTVSQAITPVALEVGWYWPISIFTGTAPQVQGTGTASGQSVLFTSATVGDIVANNNQRFFASAFANNIMAFNGDVAWSIGTSNSPGLGIGWV
jgi:hypothetical protein